MAARRISLRTYAPIALRRALLSLPTVFDRLVPRQVQWVLRKLTGASHRAVLVGGCVRDLLLGRRPEDWDIATSATPDEVQALFPRTRPTGIKHGTVTVLVGRRALEVTTFRTEGGYRDHRRPDWVAFTDDLREDLSRRDFTVNAMALSADGELYDPFGGIADLEARKIRAVGDPSQRFQEDALRMLRAVRFSAQLGFTLARTTRQAIERHSDLLSHVSRERIRDEFNKLILAPKPAPALRVLQKTGLMTHIIPELLEGVGMMQNEHHAYTVWEHNIRTCQYTPPDLALRLAGLLHDVAKPRTLSVDADGKRHFYHHEIVGARMADAILRRLRYDNQTRERVVHLIRHHLALHHYPGMTDAAVRRLIRRIGLEYLEDLIKLRMADRRASGTKRSPLSRGTRLLLKRIEQVLQEDAAFGLKDLSVNGHDLMDELGLNPGPIIGRLLNDLLEWVLDEPERNQRAVLLARARELLQAYQAEGAAPASS